MTKWTNCLPIRPIVSNIGTATCNSVSHLAKILSLLNKCKYAIYSAKHFMKKVTQETVHDRHKMALFDAKSLFTNVPLEKSY